MNQQIAQTAALAICCTRSQTFRTSNVWRTPSGTGDLVMGIFVIASAIFLRPADTVIAVAAHLPLRKAFAVTPPTDVSRILTGCTIIAAAAI